MKIAAVTASASESERNEVLAAGLDDLDGKRIVGSIGRIRECEPSVGAALAGCAERLTYTAILDALESCVAQSVVGTT